MSDSPRADASQLVSIGTVAAANIAKALNANPATVPVIERAIKDEVNAMSSHFTLAFADIQTQYEGAVFQAKQEYQREVAQIKSVWKFAREHAVALAVGYIALLAIGIAVGHWVI